jgi:hypothetical protein
VPLADVSGLEIGPPLVPLIDAYLSSRERPVVA